MVLFILSSRLLLICLNVGGYDAHYLSFWKSLVYIYLVLLLFLAPYGPELGEIKPIFMTIINLLSPLSNILL